MYVYIYIYWRKLLEEPIGGILVNY
jgi:hypothetical protein